MRKLLSLNHWRHVFMRVFRLMKSREVKLSDKLLFLIPVALYWVLPDVMPFMPIDDIAVTMMAASWFAGKVETKYKHAAP